MPWLFSGGTLSLHQAFDGAAFAAQCCERCDVAVLAGPLIFRLPEAGLVGGRRGPHTVVAVWRAPERFAGSPPWPERECPLIDVVAFGEIGVVANRRKGEGKPAAIMAGSTAAPRNLGDGLMLVHVARNAAGMIALTGAMVPQHAFPPQHFQEVIKTRSGACAGASQSGRMHQRPGLHSQLFGGLLQ